MTSSMDGYRSKMYRSSSSMRHTVPSAITVMSSSQNAITRKRAMNASSHSQQAQGQMWQRSKKSVNISTSKNWRSGQRKIQMCNPTSRKWVSSTCPSHFLKNSRIPFVFSEIATSLRSKRRRTRDMLISVTLKRSRKDNFSP